MATIYQTQGTSSIWKTSGGAHVITLTSLASGAGRKGDAHDFGVNFPQTVRVELKTKIAVAPTLGKTIDLFWVSSIDNASFDAQLAAGDGALSDINTIYQMSLIGPLVLLANTNAQSQSWTFQLPSRYGFPVVVNNSGQAIGATAADHVLTFVPIFGGSS